MIRDAFTDFESPFEADIFKLASQGFHGTSIRREDARLQAARQVGIA